MEIGSLVFGLAGLLALVCFMPPLAGRLRLPYSVLLAICGCLIAYASHVYRWLPPVVGEFLGIINTLDLEPETYLVVFLPILLFETALAMNVRRLMADLAPILTMAIVAVFVSTIFVGVIVSQFSTVGLITCLLLGAIVATTDPAAVVGIFKEVGAPTRLNTLVEGESLLNDAAAIAVYTVLLAVLATNKSWHPGLILLDTAMLFVGGGLTGYILGRLSCELFSLLRGWPAAEISLTVALAYLSYFVSEHYLHVSGVVATVVSGLVVGSAGRTKMAPSTFQILSVSWHQFGFWANSLIFLFAAMLIPRMLSNVTWENVGQIGLVFVATLLARAVVVFGLLPILSRVGLSARVNGRYKAALCWGGLRGAVSLALALAVLEHDDLPQELKHFIGVTATGFVLATLLLNGLSLRPLIGLLGLNLLSPKERALRNTAVVVATTDIQQETDRLAEAEGLALSARARIRKVFAQSIEHVSEAQIHQFSAQDRLEIGLAILARREYEMFFEILDHQVIDAKVAEILLDRAERAEDAVRSRGVHGFHATTARALRYPRRFRHALSLHKNFGVQRWLASALAERFALLLMMRSVGNLVVRFADKELRSLLENGVTEQILELYQTRMHAINESLAALNLQYPKYAIWLQEQYLGRIARKLERERYTEMLGQSLISGEVYRDLIDQLQGRWVFLEHEPPLDMEMAAKDLVMRVPLLQELSADKQIEVARLLRPRLVLPGQLILGKDKPTTELYFVASGAVSVLLPDGTHIELGTGEFFGELYLLSQNRIGFEVRSMGYTKLLCLPARDFKALLSHDDDLRLRIESVAQQRLRAIEVWQKQQTLQAAKLDEASAGSAPQ
jgi:CPA1 family monovalent cation:H+ antiporter